jgi:hypothetical protein
VELWSAQTPCPHWLRTSSPQIPPAIHTLFPFPCGSRGKNAPASHSTCLFSKSPELHSQDLENLHPSQTRSNREDGQPFHFSCVNYGYYCLFYYFLFLFLLPRRTLCSRKEERVVEVTESRSYPPNPSAIERHRRIQRCAPFFHVQQNDKVNTIIGENKSTVYVSHRR